MKNKLLKLIPHFLVLFCLLLVEASRLSIYLETLVQNQLISGFLAFILLSIVFYYAFYEFEDLSFYATLVCIVISILSYINPIRLEFEKSNKIETKNLISIPVYNFQGQYWHEKMAYIKNLENITKQVEKQNQEIEKWNAKQESKGLDYLSLFKLISTALVFSFFVPFSVYRISHRLSESLKGINSSNFEIDKKSMVIAEVLQKKKSVSVIANEYSISRQIIYEWLREYEIPLRKYQKREKGKQLEENDFTNSKLILTNIYN